MGAVEGRNMEQGYAGCCSFGLSSGRGRTGQRGRERQANAVGQGSWEGRWVAALEPNQTQVGRGRLGYNDKGQLLSC